MEALQQEVQIAIQKFQEQGREIVEAKFKQEVDGLKQELVSKNKRVEFLEQENTHLKKGYKYLNEKLGGLVDIISKSISATDEKGLPLPLDSAEEEERARQESESDLEQSRFDDLFCFDDDDKGLETKEPKLHSIKDRITHMNHDHQKFTKQLSTIGKKMADYYRKVHNGEDPSKRDEKINEKHTSPVCVYSENDWEYMDYLIKTSLEIQ